MLTKDAQIKLKVGPDDGLTEGQFTAYASVFNNIDSYGDVVMPGAFAKDLERWEKSGNPIPLLFGHEMRDPDFNLGHVVDAKEDDTGLLVTAELDLENPKAKQVYRMLKGRRINQMSFAYDVIEGGPASRRKEGDENADDPETETYYELRELKLYEVSIVTVGANQETEILAVKQVPSVAERTLADIKAGRVLSAKNETELRDAHDAIGRVLSALDSTDSDEEKASDSGPSRQAPEEASREASRKSSVNASALLEAINGQLSAEFA
ncbi:HK97 family phage prohead protease [Mycolicibacterium elephantis]|uniref:HK97 family phage prohead protease n=1 Tax=Mycolicibacterium elephantis TaxID=81858 RepID=UPI0007E95D09|nr:HK97 family phage prohead protease [Mycolicibacterium elephantis]OBB20608.1 primosome assembly protein PriA [Mycolicibacterium elephantis]